MNFKKRLGLACVVALSPSLLIAPAAFAAGPSDAEGSSAKRELCAFIEESDDVHYSKAGGINAHGWWVWRSGTSDSCKTKYPKAKVTVALQSSLDGKKWTTRTTGDPATLKPGKGSGNWAFAPFSCKNDLLTKWRPLVDVDVIGLIDDPTKVPGKVVERNCGY